MSHLPLRILYYGKDEPLPERRHLRAGPLSLIFEEGSLRSVRLGEREVVRWIYVAVRDLNWGTVAPRLSNLNVEDADGSFRVTFDMEHKQDDVDFLWKGTITGDADGTVSFTMDGAARSTFRRNRIGFCVLHPMIGGCRCRVEKVDGTVEQSTFPRFISPHQPFMDIQAIAHEIAPDVWAEVRFEGEVFEMEDHRNWTDASFKTYGTPLRLPFPVEVKEGTKMAQSVTLRLEAAKQRNGATAQRRETQDAIRFDLSSFTADSFPLPHIGLGVASHGQPLTEKEISRLRALNLSHLRVDVNLTQPDYASTLRRASDEAKALGVSLEVALFVSDNAIEELSAFVKLLEQVNPSVGGWLVFHVAEKSTTERWVRLAREHLTPYDPSAKIGAGSNAYFTELNRGRPPVAALDLVCYSINPQVHAFDNASLVETLEAQAATVESARQFVGNLPVAITPVTLNPRFNPNATAPEPEPALGALPEQVDVRQMSLFGAGWTLGSLKYLCESGVFSVTCYETTGWRGVMETENGSPLPDQFRSLPGAVFPMYHVLADIGEFAGGEVIAMTSSDTLKVNGLAIRKDGKLRALLTNFTDETQIVTVQNLPTTVRVRRLNETNAEQAMLSPETLRAQEGEIMPTSKETLTLNLLPYEIVRIDT